ncbi:MAG: hypothetical protein NXI31_02935 [bacterium]|nr:hypothetical protein [bacterium]
MNLRPFLVPTTALLSSVLSAQTIAEFSFDSDDLTSPQPAFATVSDLAISNSYMFGGPSSDRWLCLTTAWNNVGGTVSFTVTPNAGVAIDYGALTWQARTNAPHLSDSVRAATLRVNGQVVDTIDPLEHLVLETIDLSSFAPLQGNENAVTFEIEFVGNPNGQTAYEIGELNLTGGVCVPAINNVQPTALPQITNDCFLITGDCFNTLQGVKFGGTAIPGGSGPYPGRYGEAFYTIMSPTLLKVCPPFCLPVDDYEIRLVFPNTELTTTVQIVTPPAVTVACQPNHKVGTEQCVFLSSGPQPGPNNLFLGLSSVNQPSVLPGIVSLGIGAQFTNALCLNAPPGECVEVCIGVISPAVVGTSSYFQAIAWNFFNPILPLPVSAVCESVYVH